MASPAKRSKCRYNFVAFTWRYIIAKKECLSFIQIKQKYKYVNQMQIMLMNINEKMKLEKYPIVPKGTKLTGLGKSGLSLEWHDYFLFKKKIFCYQRPLFWLDIYELSRNIHCKRTTVLFIIKYYTINDYYEGLDRPAAPGCRHRGLDTRDWEMNMYKGADLPPDSETHRCAVVSKGHEYSFLNNSHCI